MFRTCKSGSSSLYSFYATFKRILLRICSFAYEPAWLSGKGSAVPRLYKSAQPVSPFWFTTPAEPQEDSEVDKNITVTKYADIWMIILRLC